jgi:pilus assembly protein FimV
MVKKQALAVLILLMSFVGSSFGLGLGDINVNSNLNDPLEAEIKIIQLQGLTSGEILPTLASNDDFRRAGVERNFFLSNIQFRVKENASGEVFITLATKQAVREPFLNFLVEVNWPGGRLLKEYTILLDPPVFDTGLAVDALVVEGANANSEIVTTTVIENSVVQDTVAVNNNVEPRDDTLPPGEYRVQRNDTLWEIALKVPAGKGYSPQQVMLAIQDLNAQAFLNNNINRVKAGSVLTLPDESQIALRSFQEAINEVKAQNQGAAPNLRNPAASGNEAQLSATDTTGSALVGDGDSKNPDGYLELSADSNNGISGTGETSEDVDQLLGQLAIAEELNDQYVRERDDLQSKVTELQEQIEIMERLLDVQNGDIAQVQQALEQTEEAQAEADGEATNADTATPVVEEPVVETPAVTTPTATTPVKATPPMPVKQDFMWYVNEYTGLVSNWVMKSTTNMAIAGGGLLLLLLIPFYIRSKRGNGDKTLSEMNEEVTDFEVENDDISNQLDDDLLSEVEDDFEEEIEDEPEQIDAVMEAEMYMAYQKYDQAEEKLKEAFADYPGRADIGLKLMEVYAETGNANGFNDIESRITMSPHQQEEAEALRAKLPIDQLGSDDSDLMTADDDFDLDLSSSLSDDASSLGSDIDFDIDLGEDDKASTVVAQPDELSFDLELGEDESIATLNTDDLSLPDSDKEADELSTDLDFSLDLGDLDISDESEAKEGSLDFSLDDDDAPSLTLDESEPEESDAIDFSLDMDDESLTFDEAESTEEISLDIDEETEDELDTELSLDSELSTEAEVSELDLGELDLALDDVELNLDEEIGADATDIELSLDEDVNLDDEDDGVDDFDLSVEGSTEDISINEDDSFDIDLSEDASLESGDDVDPLQQLADSLDSDAELDEDEFDFLSGSDEISTKLDLARAYIEMEDKEGARDILDEVVQEGNDEQKSQAEALISQL